MSIVSLRIHEKFSQGVSTFSASIKTATCSFHAIVTSFKNRSLQQTLTNQLSSYFLKIFHETTKLILKLQKISPNDEAVISILQSSLESSIHLFVVYGLEGKMYLASVTVNDHCFILQGMVKRIILMKKWISKQA